MVKRLSVLLALSLSVLVLTGGSYDRGGYASRSGYQGGLVAAADTFRLLVWDGTEKNTAASDSGFVVTNGPPNHTPDATFYNLITADDASGNAMRYGGLRYSQPDTAVQNASLDTYGVYTGRASEDNLGQFPNYLGFIALNVTGLTAGDRVLDSYLNLNDMSFTGTDASSGYIAARLDTVLNDYAMLNSVSASADSRRILTSFNEVDKTNGIAWDPPIYGAGHRDDFHDFGPMSEKFTNSGANPSNEGTCNRLDITKAMQHALDRDLFSSTDGWAIFIFYAQAATPTQYAAFAMGPNAKKGSPALTATTVNRRGAKVWGTGGIPFTISIDDNYPDHIGYYQVIAGLGKTFQAATHGDGFGATKDSLNSNAGAGTIQYLAHSITHPGLGDLTGAALNTEIERAWYEDGRITDPPDTNLILDFVWPGSGTNPNSIEAIEGMVAQGYRSARTPSRGGYVNLGVGLRSNLSWDAPTNPYMMTANNTIWGGASSTYTNADIKEAFMDELDLLTSDFGRAAMHVFGHSFAVDGVTLSNLGYLVSLVDVSYGVSYMDLSEIMSKRLSSPIDPATIAAMDITTTDAAAIKASAVSHDSLITIVGGHDALLEIWQGAK